MEACRPGLSIFGRDLSVSLVSRRSRHFAGTRIIFLKFFASILGGYRNFIESTTSMVFNTQAFLKKRSRSRE